MYTKHLLTTPTNLQALWKVHPMATLQGPTGFISTEAVFRDARASHELHAIVSQLYKLARLLQKRPMEPRQAAAWERQIALAVAETLKLAGPWV